MRTFRSVVLWGVALWSCALQAQTVRMQDGPPPEPKISQAELTSKMGAYLDDLTAKDEFSGVVLLARGGLPVFEKAYGLASKEYNVPNDLETKFNLGSIDKVFTKIAIGQLVAAGKVGIDDKLEKYLPDYPNKDAAQKVTIRQLVNMRSGIGDFFGPKFRDLPKDKLRSLADFLPLFAAEPLAFEPGSNRRYSNGGYIVLGVIIEKVMGQSYYDYIREHITKPLGMDGTEFYEADVPTPNLASGYSRGSPDEESQTGPRHNNIYTRPARGSSAGGGYSNVHDMLKFANALESGKIANPDFSPEHPQPGAPFSSMRGIGVAGGAPGINATLDTALPGDYTLIVMSNYDPPTAMKVSRQVREWMGLRED